MQPNGAASMTGNALLTPEAVVRLLANLLKTRKLRVRRFALIDSETQRVKLRQILSGHIRSASGLIAIITMRIELKLSQLIVFVVTEQ
jgi:hypothetical protein